MSQLSNPFRLSRTRLPKPLSRSPTSKPKGLGICQGHGLRVDRQRCIHDLTDLHAKHHLRVQLVLQASCDVTRECPLTFLLLLTMEHSADSAGSRLIKASSSCLRLNELQVFHRHAAASFVAEVETQPDPGRRRPRVERGGSDMIIQQCTVQNSPFSRHQRAPLVNTITQHLHRIKRCQRL